MAAAQSGVVTDIAGLGDLAGAELGQTEWAEMTQAQVDAFAECTEDRQWIHVDVERARLQSPYGAQIAHGFLTLSLLPVMAFELLGALEAKQSINYGLDKLRFIAPVKAGARIRNRMTLLAAETRADGWVLLRMENRVEIEGEAKPALVAVTLTLVSPR